MSGDSISRAERDIEAFRRAKQTIELDENQLAIANKWIAEFETELAVTQGKSFLLNGDYREAAVAFRVANKHRRSLKLSVITFLAEHAPSLLVKFFKKHRSDDIAMMRTLA